MAPQPSRNVRLPAWPIYYREKLRIGNLDSNVGVATLWTPLELVARHLQQSDYAVIGQLYSKSEGLNALLRNCLANPNLRTIILYGQDRTGSGEMLLRLKSMGMDSNHRIRDTNVYVDLEIPVESVEKFRRHVDIMDLRSTADPKAVAEAIRGRPRQAPYSDPEVFPMSKVRRPKRFPSENAGFLVRGRFVGEVWLLMLDAIHRFGVMKQSHESESYQEIIDLMTVVTEEDPHNPSWRPYLPFSPSELKEYFPQFLTPMEQKDLSYTYGQRLMSYRGIDQVAAIVDKLRKSLNTRRALAVTWDVESDLGSENPPCVTALQWLCRDSKLILTAYIRSNDVFGAWPQNAFALRRLQQQVCDAVNETTQDQPLSIGDLITVSASAHVYQRNMQTTLEILKDYPLEKNITHNLKGGVELDTRGNITVQVRDGRIHLTHLDHEGVRIDEYTAKNARDAQAWLFYNQKIGDVSHALYLGRELEKAELALKHNLAYEQDKPLVGKLKTLKDVAKSSQRSEPAC